MHKRIICIFACVVIVLCAGFSAGAYTPTGFTVDAHSALLVSLDTGEVLYNKNETEKVYPASITKIMTLIVMLESERYNPEAPVTMTEEVQNLISGTDSSVSNLQIGEQIRQIDLAYYVLVSSAGDCAYLAAFTYYDSVEAFVDKMNEKAKELGMEGTHYQNPVGLHSKENYTTAYDTYILTKYALKNETFKTICECNRYTIPATNMSGERTISTTNFLHDNTTDYYYQYAQGVKTGYTDEAGRCLVSTASYNGYNYMCVLFKCTVSNDTRYEFIDSRNLYRWAFNNFSLTEVADTKNPVYEVPIDLAWDTDYVALYVEKGFVTILPNEADTSTVTIKPNIKKGTRIKAPVKKGDVIGTADIIYAENVIGTVNLVAGEDIDKSIILTVYSTVTSFLSSVYMIIIYIILGVVALGIIIYIITVNSKRTKKRKVKYIPLTEDEKKAEEEKQ